RCYLERAAAIEDRGFRQFARQRTVDGAEIMVEVVGVVHGTQPPPPHMGEVVRRDRASERGGRVGGRYCTPPPVRFANDLPQRGRWIDRWLISRSCAGEWRYRPLTDDWRPWGPSARRRARRPIWAANAR